MDRLRGASFLFFLLLVPAIIYAQSEPAASSDQPTAKPDQAAAPSPAVAVIQTPIPPPSGPPIPANAPHMSKDTRYQIIRDFETQLVYSRTAFPMGSKGLILKKGVTTPNGQDLQQMLALWGPSIKPGDPAHISFVQIKDNHIHFDLNGGAIRRRKWYEHIQVSGAGGTAVPLSPNESQQNAHGSYLDLYFDKYVPEMTAQQLRDLLLPVLDFNAKNKEQAYLDTLPPKVRAAVEAHHVLVGMNSDMVLHAKGKPPKKVREKDGDTPYEEWIYGEPPQDVDFVRIVNDEVVRVETMKVGGEKIVRTEKEVILKKPDEETEAKKEDQDRQSNAPTLRRPGEDPEDVPKPANGPAPLPPPPPDVPQSPAMPGYGPIIAGR
jgi:hypothetical protein